MNHRQSWSPDKVGFQVADQQRSNDTFSAPGVIMHPKALHARAILSVNRGAWLFRASLFLLYGGLPLALQAQEQIP